MDFIPLQAGQATLLKDQPMISDLLGDVGYTPYGNKVIFSRDITAEGISFVDFVLVVFDIDQYGDYDPLPIPKDSETDLVDELVKRFAPITGTAKFSDFISPNAIGK